ncbi:MAG: hypothetical protein ACLT98_14880 [Eggerthellaceae bacterium]
MMVSPVDRPVEAGEQATFAAYTNDDMASATRTYKWEARPGKDPDDPATTWTEVTASTATAARWRPETRTATCAVRYAAGQRVRAAGATRPARTSRACASRPAQPEVDANARLVRRRPSFRGTATSREPCSTWCRPIGEATWSREFVRDGKASLDNLAPGDVRGVRPSPTLTATLPSGWVGSPFARGTGLAFSVESRPAHPASWRARGQGPLTATR